MFPGFMRVLAERESPFGKVTVVHDTVSRVHAILNNDTWHGWQNCDPERKTLPTSYYTETSPVADLFSLLSDNARIGVIGLGVGVCASLARQGQHITFYEIDPVVIEIARDPRYFSFLADSKATCDVVEGDALTTIFETPAEYFDLLLLDAFFGDEVSGETQSADAVRRFGSRLAPDGTLAFHITSTQRRDDHIPSIVAATPGYSLAHRTGMSDPTPRDPDLEIEEIWDLSLPVISRWAVASRNNATISTLIDAYGWTAL
jgi:spermidine synthase